MTEDMISEAMAQAVPSHLRPRKWMPRTNGAQHRRIDHDRVVALRAEGLTYRQIAELHRQRSGYAITEAMPQIDLQSDKIQRPLTTGWFAARVGSRDQQCLRAPM